MTASERPGAGWFGSRAPLVAAVVLAVVWALPIVLMLSTSLKTQGQLAFPTHIVPHPFAFGNFLAVLFESFPFGHYMANSFTVSLFTVIGDVLSCSFIAYGFAILRFPGRRLLFVVMLSTMMFPFAVRMIPLFLIFKWLGWINTYLPLVVPPYFGINAFFIFLLHQFFRGIPGTLIEAARIDGAGEFRIWRSIVLPLSRPALAVVALLSFEQSWNDFAGAAALPERRDQVHAAARPVQHGWRRRCRQQLEPGDGRHGDHGGAGDCRVRVRATLLHPGLHHIRAEGLNDQLEGSRCC